MWDPDVYLAFSGHRNRPFYELVSRVGLERARRVVDLGCGPGHLTRYLARRWPGAVIEALDSSPEMVAAAAERGIDATTGDLRDWKPKPDTDVVVSNAALHWVPEHSDLLVRWVDELAPGSWIAVPDPRQLRDAVARRGTGVGPPRAVCKANARHTFSCGRGGPISGVLRGAADGHRLQGRRVGDHVPTPADRRAPGVGLDYRKRAGPSA